MSRTISTLILAGALAALTGTAHAQTAPATAVVDEELLRSPDMTLTRAEWDAYLLRVPPDQRAAFAASPQRVQTEVNNLIVAKTLAARARRAGLANDPLVQRRMALEADRALAAAMIEKIEADARAEFDRMPAQSSARARELYALEAKRFAVPELVDASHILFSTQTRTAEQALTAAKEARAKLLAGADFAALARELSDDPSAKRNAGRLGNFARGRMDSAFESVAFAQTKIGEISEPVLTKFGYHLIRHEGRIPGRQPAFAEVEPQIVEEMRRDYVQRAREDALNAIRGDPKLVVNKPALERLLVRIPLPPQTDPTSAKPGS